MRKGIVHTFAQLQRPNQVLAARLIPQVLESPACILSDWADYCRFGHPRNTCYCKNFEQDVVHVAGINVKVPEFGNVFMIAMDEKMRIFDYDWLEKCDLPGLPKGHDNPDVCGGAIWTPN